MMKLKQRDNVMTSISNILNNVRGTTFASITYTTPVSLAAKHKDITISKTTVANIIMANNLKEFTNLYLNKVQRRIGGTFELSETWFSHTPCYSVVQHKGNGSLYLYAIFSSVGSSEYADGAGNVLSKQQVAAYLTPANREKLLNPAPVYNAKNDVEHDVHVRTIKLENVTCIKTAGQVFVGPFGL